MTNRTKGKTVGATNKPQSPGLRFHNKKTMAGGQAYRLFSITSYKLLTEDMPNSQSLPTTPRLPCRASGRGELDGYMMLGKTSPSGLIIPCYHSASHPCTPSTSPFVHRPSWKSL